MQIKWSHSKKRRVSKVILWGKISEEKISKNQSFKELDLFSHMLIYQRKPQRHVLEDTGARGPHHDQKVKGSLSALEGERGHAW